MQEKMRVKCYYFLGAILAFCFMLMCFPVEAAANEGEPDIVSVDAYGFAMAVIKDDGSLWTWGSNWRRQLDDSSDPDSNYYFYPEKVTDDVVSASIGLSDGVMVKSDGSLWQWNREWNPGDDTENYELTYVMDNVISADMGDVHALAAQADGSVWEWKPSYNPTPVKVLENAVFISAGYFHSAAITTDDSLWLWGSNSHGQIGNGTTIDSELPVKIMDDVAFVKAGRGATAAIKNDGSLWMWGNNSSGNLGTGTTEDSLIPVKVMDDVKSVSTFNNHTLAVKTDGSLWGWGDNEYGVVKYDGGGNYSYEYNSSDDYPHNYYSPIYLMDNVHSAYVGANLSAIVKLDGSLWTWGYNSVGQLGDSTTEIRPHQPVHIMDNIMLSGGAVATTPTTPTTPDTTTTPDGIIAIPSPQTVTVNGKLIAFEAYNIDGNNYFKLRDLAYSLNGTEKQFQVGWDAANNVITLESLSAYSPVGGEMSGKATDNKTGQPTDSTLYLDGNEAYSTAYNIDGNNYFKLRDIGIFFNFGVDYDSATNTIIIDTSKGY